MSSRAYRRCGCQVGLTDNVDVKSGLQRMWMSSRAFSKPRHSLEAGEEVHTPDI